MTGLISIIHALQTSACYLRLGSTGTEVEQGRALSRRVHRGVPAAAAVSGQQRARRELRVVTPRPQDRNRLHVSALFPTHRGCSHCPQGRALPPFPPTSSPQSLCHPQEDPAGSLCPQRDMGSVSQASNTSFGTFRSPAVFASQLSKP